MAFVFLLRQPGHKTYIPSMITGSSQVSPLHLVFWVICYNFPSKRLQADLAALVISARKGEFETGFEKGGQTRE